VFEFDEVSRVYRKYQLVDGKLMFVHVGIRIGEIRGIAWMDLTHAGGSDTLNTEIYEDEGKTSTVLLCLNRKPVNSRTAVSNFKGP